MNVKGTALPSLPCESRGTHRDSVIIFLLGLLAFTFGLAPEFVGFQARFALFAQEMLRNGPSFFPTAYGRPYPDYPSGSIFLIYLASLPFGRVTAFSAVLPSALAAAVILVLTYRLGALRSRRWGLAAALFSILTVEFIGEARATALDQYVSLVTVLSFYLVYSADRLGRMRRLWILPLVWVFGFAFRGPLGLVIPLAVACSYCLWNMRFRRLLVLGAAGAVVLALCIKGLLLAAALQGGTALAQKVLQAQITGRISDRGPGALYYWLRCPTAYALSCPIAFLIVACRFKDILRRATDDDRLLGSLSVWVLTVLIGMSIPSAKHTRYVLPIIPALALLASYLVVDASPRGAVLALRGLLERAASILPWVAAAGLAGMCCVQWQWKLDWQAHYVTTIAALLGLVLASTRSSARRLEPGLRSLGVCAAVFVIVNIGVADPVGYGLERTGPFVRQVEALREDRPGDIVFFRMGPDQEDIKFVVNASRPVQPRFTSSLDELKRLGEGPYIIADEQVFGALPPEIGSLARPAVRGKIGHENVVVFTLQPPAG